MVNAFAITFRESLEAFLIVAVTLAFLRRTGVRGLVAAVHAGIVLSPLASVIAGYLFSRVENQALWEGVFAVIAATSVIILTVHLWRTVQHMRGDLDRQLRAAVLRGGVGGWTAVFLFTLLMIAREGMGIGLLMAALVFQMEATDLVAGAAAGVVTGFLLAWAWSHYLPRVSTTLFLQVATIFLVLFTGELLIGGVYALADAGVLPASDTLRWVTEPFAADGVYGPYLTLLIAAVPLGWLLLAIFFGHGKAADGRIAHVGR